MINLNLLFSLKLLKKKIIELIYWNQDLKLLKTLWPMICSHLSVISDDHWLLNKLLVLLLNLIMNSEIIVIKLVKKLLNKDINLHLQFFPIIYLCLVLKLVIPIMEVKLMPNIIVISHIKLLVIKFLMLSILNGNLIKVFFQINGIVCTGGD